MQNNAFKIFDLVPKLEVLILALDQKFLINRIGTYG